MFMFPHDYIQVMHIWQKYHHIISGCLIINNEFDNLVYTDSLVVMALITWLRFFHSKLIYSFLFIINKKFVGRYFELI